MHIYSVFLKSFFCRGGDKETDRRRKIRCLHFHSRVEGVKGMLIVLTVGGGKGMFALCIWSILLFLLYLLALSLLPTMLVCSTVKSPMVGMIF
jgi:hypothetical protein